jgi:short-subunit dehydrogenase
LGQAFVKALQQAGATKIYAAARDPSGITVSGVVPIKLDVTSVSDIAAAAQCKDVTLLINNAGIHVGIGSLLSPESTVAARKEYEVNFFGTLAMSQAFAPILAANGGGAIVNVLSALSWINMPGAATYAATKAAAWSLTNGLRNELRQQGTQVVALHAAFMDTDMARGVNMPKTDPYVVAQRTLEGVQQGDVEILADGISAHLKQSLSAGCYLQPPSRG